MTMLLTVLLVMDDSSHYKTEALTQSFESRFSAFDGWKGNYEILVVTLSDNVLEETAGKLSIINALIVNNGHLAQCSGKYVWILPSFIAVGDNPDTFTALFDALSMGVDAVMLCTYPNDVTQKNVEIINLTLDSLPTPQLFEEFRYITRQDDLVECFSKDADFHATPVHLTFKESQKARALYAKIPCDLAVIHGVVGHALFLLSLSFFSGTRSWQREILVLPRCLLHHNVMDQGRNALSQGQRGALMHFLFSSCSALEQFSGIMFSESTSGLVRDEIFSIVKQVVVYLERLSSTLAVDSDLSEQIAKLSYFINYWQQTAGVPVASENVANPEAKKSVFDGIWWLGRALKDDFNQLGKQHFLNLVQLLRKSVEEYNL